MNFKYVRIQGRELAADTMMGAGVFSMCFRLLQDEVMDEEDAALYKEIDRWFVEKLPLPDPCLRHEPVVCYFKTENTDEMMRMITPAMWLLERYHHPFYLVYTNHPGEIVYEDEYQVVVRVPKPEVKQFRHGWIGENGEMLYADEQAGAGNAGEASPAASDVANEGSVA